MAWKERNGRYCKNIKLFIFLLYQCKPESTGPQEDYPSLILTLRRANPKKILPQIQKSMLSLIQSLPSTCHVIQIAHRAEGRTHQIGWNWNHRIIVDKGSSPQKIVYSLLRRIWAFRQNSYCSRFAAGHKRQQNGWRRGDFYILGGWLLRHAERQVRRRSIEDSYSGQVFHWGLEGGGDEDV